MSLARFLCVCVDALDPDRLGPWWADVLDLQWVAHDRPPAVGEARGPAEGQRVLIMAVQKPKSVKHRVHLDIYTRSLADLEARGATRLETYERWTVMADPEGGEFCAFVRDELPSDRLHGLAVDCADPASLAQWWAEVYDAELVRHDGWWTVENVPGMPILTMDFAAVPEPKTVKNRIHWDVTASDVAALVAKGATILREPDDDINWTVMADPEGNEFCAFPNLAAQPGQSVRKR